MVKPLKTETKQWVSCSDLDSLVKKVYQRPYSFQQQDDCKARGTHHVSVPVKRPDDYSNKTVAEEINGEEMGVSFSAWLARSPKAWGGAKKDARYIDMFWERNFYPNVEMVLNDLHARGLLAAGDYVIEIDW